MPHHSAIFLSDLHLGSRGCQAQRILAFLNENSSDTLYLVGDIVDFWKLKRSFYFPSDHQAVLCELVKRAKTSNVYYITGNHDDVLRQFSPMSFANIHLYDKLIHHSIGGDKFLVIHGDIFDPINQQARWLSHLGDIIYELSIKLNSCINRMRRLCGRTPWSLSKCLKGRTKVVVQIIGNYETAIVEAVRQHGVDGVICGHIHHAEIKYYDNIRYINSGDGVESCTAIIEDHDGCFKIIEFPH